MFATRVTTGTVYPGEMCVDIRPKTLGREQAGVVAFVHGAGSQADYCLHPEPAKQAYLTQKVGSIWPAISGDIGGTITWGNNTAILRLGGYLSRVASVPGAAPGEYALVSASMGGLTSLNYAAQAAVKPRAIVSVIPVINLHDIVSNNRDGYAAGINAAYGGLYMESTMGEAHNPYTMRAAAKLAGIPMLLFYGQTDTLCLPEFVEEFAAADPMNRQLVPLPFGHDYDSYAAVDHDLIVEFLREHLR